MGEQFYHPLLSTLRLYAGWLLACLLVIYALGSYQELRQLPIGSPLFTEWVESPLILRVAFVTFIFLLLSEIHRLIGKGFWKGLMLTVVGFLALVVFQMNT